MRVRPLVLGVVLLGSALGAAGCSSSGGAPEASRSGGAGLPGTVTVKSGNNVVCVITLNSSGTGSCKINSGNYPAGQDKFTAAYAGTGKYKTGTANTILTIFPTSKASPPPS